MKASGAHLFILHCYCDRKNHSVQPVVRLSIVSVLYARDDHLTEVIQSVKSHTCQIRDKTVQLSKGWLEHKKMLKTHEIYYYYYFFLVLKLCFVVKLRFGEQNPLHFQVLC